jgi:pimeloyl-ACP methyl ester carboxylesterase
MGGEAIDADSPWFEHQATSLHQLDPDVLSAVQAGPDVMLAGYEPEVLLPRITCPVLLLQADPAIDNVLQDDDVELAMRLLPDAQHVQLPGVGHSLHSPAGMTPVILDAIAPFLGSLERVDRPARQPT